VLTGADGTNGADGFFEDPAHFDNPATGVTLATEGDLDAERP
jgi:hypothetical protein